MKQLENTNEHPMRIP